MTVDQDLCRAIIGIEPSVCHGLVYLGHRQLNLVAMSVPLVYQPMTNLGALFLKPNRMSLHKTFMFWLSQDMHGWLLDTEGPSLDNAWVHLPLINQSK